MKRILIPDVELANKLLAQIKMVSAFQVFALSVLEGNCPGEILVDSSGLTAVCWSGGCYLILGDLCSQAELERMLYEILNKVEHHASVLGLYVSFGENRGERSVGNLPSHISLSEGLVFSSHNPRTLNMTGISVTNIVIRDIVCDDVSFQKLRGDIVSKWGSVERFLKNGFGKIAAASGSGRILGYCFTGAIGGGRADFSINVDKNFREIGLGTSLGKALCLETYRRELSPVWTCMKENIASVKLAEKLGFTDRKEFPFLLWHANRSMTRG